MNKIAEAKSSTVIEDVYQTVLVPTAKAMVKEGRDRLAVCVIMSSKGYPADYPKGLPITINDKINDSQIYIAGAKKKDGEIVTSGGRVLGVTALGSSIKEAKEKAYESVRGISFEGAHYRTDIADKAIKR